MKSTEQQLSSLQKGIVLLKLLSQHGTQGMRLNDITQTLQWPQSTTHRLLKTLVDERLVSQPEDSKRYRLDLEFFHLANKAADGSELRRICRPHLLRLLAGLNDSIFLMIRHGFDVMCLDRIEGPFPIRTHTGDIGGKIPLGVGQGGMVLLSYLPPQEQDEIIRFNVPRLLDTGIHDEVYFRSEIKKTLAQGYNATNHSQMVSGMAGLSVPIFDAQKKIVAALSVGTLSERLSEDRLPIMVDMLRRSADEMGALINPLDKGLRHPSQALGL